MKHLGFFVYLMMTILTVGSLYLTFKPALERRKLNNKNIAAITLQKEGVVKSLAVPGQGFLHAP